MIDQFLKASSLFRPEDERLTRKERDRVQLYRLMSLLGATLIPSFGLLYRLSNPEGVNPAWAQYGLAGLFATLFAASVSISGEEDGVPGFMSRTRVAVF